jgi:glutamate-1-semialdehyde 2,1-aminomutase
VTAAGVTGLLERERERFAPDHPRSRELHRAARGSLLAGVPMSWMTMWAGGHPVYFAEARGARIVDVDRNEYADFCLGDTGAMAGHSPEPTMRAVREAAGITTMLPTEDAAWLGGELARRFGLPYWQFALTATDANRWLLRICRQVTRRPKVLVFNWCYHGSVDEAFVTLGDDRVVRSREGNVGPAVDPAEITRVAEFNELDSVEAALADGQVACLLMEPALTNIGIVLPEDGFLAGVRELCTRHGTLLIIDETHTLSAGPGGCTAAWGLEPDAATLGKSIGGGVPIGAYGVSAELAERAAAEEEADFEDTGGVGGTLAGNALSLAAARATLSEVLTEDAFARMSALREGFVAGVEDAIERFSLPWSIIGLGRPRGVPLRVRAAPHRRRVRRRRRPHARGVPAPLPAEQGRADHAVPQHGADVPSDDRGSRRAPQRGVRRGGGGAVRMSVPPRAPR